MYSKERHHFADKGGVGGERGTSDIPGTPGPPGPRKRGAGGISLSCIGEENGNPLQCSCLENPRNRGAWWAAVYGVAQSRTRLKRLSSSSSSKAKQNWSTVSFAWHPFLYLEWPSYSSTRLASQSPLSVKHPCSLTVPPCLGCSPPSAVGEPLLFFECFPQLPLMLSRWSQWRGMYRHLPCSGSGSAVCAASMDFIVDPKS